LTNLSCGLSSGQLLDEAQFRCITKIKTIGSTYMAASGVTPDVSNGYACLKVRAWEARPDALFLAL
jgi:hypothetical protein